MIIFPDIFTPYIKGRETAITANQNDRIKNQDIFARMLDNERKKLELDWERKYFEGLLQGPGGGGQGGVSASGVSASGVSAGGVSAGGTGPGGSYAGQGSSSTESSSTGPSSSGTATVPEEHWAAPGGTRYPGEPTILEYLNPFSSAPSGGEAIYDLPGTIWRGATEDIPRAVTGAQDAAQQWGADWFKPPLGRDQRMTSEAFARLQSIVNNPFYSPERRQAAKAAAARVWARRPETFERGWLWDGQRSPAEVRPTASLAPPAPFAGGRQRTPEEAAANNAAFDAALAAWRQREARGY